MNTVAEEVENSMRIIRIENEKLHKSVEEL